jgi:ATP-dependent DNA helicase RecG
MNAKQLLKELLASPSENEVLEFKKATNSYDIDKLGKYFSALSNEALLNGKKSAYLIFGVQDKPRVIVGTSYKNHAGNLEKLKSQISENSSNRLTFESVLELFIEDKRILLFIIPPALPGSPTTWKGQFFGRDGESIGPLNPIEVKKLLFSSFSIDWSAETCPEAAINDLDTEALQLAKKKFTSKTRNLRNSDEITTLSAEEFLDKSGLRIRGKLTKAALLLLGKPESKHHLSPHPARITWKLEVGEVAYEHFDPPFFLSIEKVHQRIRNYRLRIQRDGRLIPDEMEKYDPSIILEALNNCIAHQDYSLRASILVSERENELIFQNAGDFFEGTIKQYLLEKRTPERYRNFLLADSMVKFDMIDTMGFGIRRMFERQKERYFSMPQYELDDPTKVVLTIPGKAVDLKLMRLLFENPNLELWDVFNLDLIQRGIPIPKDFAQILRKKKFIEGRYPNVYLSSSISKSPESKADYIKHRAFDNQYYEDMVIQFLEKNKKAKPEEIQRLLVDKISSALTEKQKKKQVTNLTQKMSRKDLIENVGKRGSSALWRLI